eukprot:m.40974 g.40974  ORF g.40974 m.40974 type:complete len:539 (-) comp11953_c0_seq1:242-1858(-)
MAFFEQPSELVAQLRFAFIVSDDSGMCRRMLGENTGSDAGRPVSPDVEAFSTIAVNEHPSVSAADKSKRDVRAVSSAPVKHTPVLKASISSAVPVRTWSADQLCEADEDRSVKQQPQQGQNVTEKVVSASAPAGALSSSSSSSKTKPADTPAPVTPLSKGSAATAAKKDAKDTKDVKDAKVLPPNNSPASGVTIFRQQNKTSVNPFAAYTQYSGEGHRTEYSRRVHIFFPFSDQPREPIDIYILLTANIEKLRGLAMYKYTEKGRTPPLQNKPSNYVLRIEDDGEIDMDIPPFDVNQSMAKVDFPSMCLCQLEPERKAQNQSVDSEGAKNYIRVYSGTGTTILQRDEHINTIQDVIAATVKKRCYKPFVEYTLESKQESGVPLPKDMLLAQLGNQSIEFCMFRQNALRKDLALQTATLDQPDPLSVHEPRVYYVTSARWTGIAMVEMEMHIDFDKFVLTQTQRSGIRQKNLQVSMQLVRLIERSDKKLRIRFAAMRGGEEKSVEVIARSLQEACEIEGFMMTILREIDNLMHFFKHST